MKLLTSLKYLSDFNKKKNDRRNRREKIFTLNTIPTWSPKYI